MQRKPLLFFGRLRKVHVQTKLYVRVTANSPANVRALLGDVALRHRDACLGLFAGEIVDSQLVDRSQDEEEQKHA